MTRDCKGVIDTASIGYENIEQFYNEIKKLRELIWVEAMNEFKQKLAVDGIELSNEALRREDFFEILEISDASESIIRQFKNKVI